MCEFILIFAQKSQDIVKNIGKIIKARRIMLGLRQDQLADIAGVGINTLTKIERGEGNPSIETLKKVLDSLGLELSLGVKTM